MAGSNQGLEGSNLNGCEKISLDLSAELLSLLEQVRIEWAVCSRAKVIELLLEELLLEGGRNEPNA